MAIPKRIPGGDRGVAGPDRRSWPSSSMVSGRIACMLNHGRWPLLTVLMTLKNRDVVNSTKWPRTECRGFNASCFHLHKVLELRKHSLGCYILDAQAG